MWTNSPQDIAEALCTRPPNVGPPLTLDKANVAIDAFRARFGVTQMAFFGTINVTKEAETAALVLLEDVAKAIRQIYPIPPNIHVKETLGQIEDMIRAIHSKPE